MKRQNGGKGLVCCLRRNPGWTLRKAESLSCGWLLIFWRETLNDFFRLLRQTVDAMKLHQWTRQGLNWVIALVIRLCWLQKAVKDSHYTEKKEEPWQWWSQWVRVEASCSPNASVQGKVQKDLSLNNCCYYTYFHCLSFMWVKQLRMWLTLIPCLYGNNAILPFLKLTPALRIKS